VTDRPDRDDHAVVRPFADVLRDLGKGQVADDAGMLLQSLVEAVQTHGKKGTFTLKIEVAPMKGDVAALLVSAKAEAKPPAGDPIAAVFFADNDHNLVREDPRQLQLPIRDTDTNVAPLRS
jgi:hypothetical protein